MYDGLTGRYTFLCPARGETRVLLSGFRTLERLAGASHPAVYKITFACACGEEHAGLVSHEELDWAPLGSGAAAFFNLMTRRVESAAHELLGEAARRIGVGAWPWSFFCYPEGKPRPVFPSAFRLLAPAEDSVGLAVSCPDCGGTSVNVVSTRHVDEPFYSDPRVAVIEHVFAAEHETMVASFREEIQSSAFDARRIAL